VEAVETVEIMKMLSAATVHVATNKTHKVGNLLKKPVSGTKRWSKRRHQGGRK
jgi:hypothetical protein